MDNKAPAHWPVTAEERAAASECPPRWPVWTDEDERLLKTLQERKLYAEQATYRNLEGVVEPFYFRNMSLDNIVDGLINSADLVTAALKPYLKEKSDGYQETTKTKNA